LASSLAKRSLIVTRLFGEIAALDSSAAVFGKMR
jgi:hypothetical protein